METKNPYTKALPEEITYQENRLLTVEERIWEEGRQAGRKEVVEWIEKNYPIGTPKWKAQLKGWNIEGLGERKNDSCDKG